MSRISVKEQQAQLDDTEFASIRPIAQNARNQQVTPVKRNPLPYNLVGVCQLLRFTMCAIVCARVAPLVLRISAPTCTPVMDRDMQFLYAEGPELIISKRALGQNSPYSSPVMIHGETTR